MTIESNKSIVVRIWNEMLYLIVKNPIMIPKVMRANRGNKGLMQ
jgi:hypothetical protein